MRLEELRAAIARIAVRSDDAFSASMHYLPFGWVVAMPGIGTGAGHFFVRGHVIEDGRPVAYDPFWIENCIEDQRHELAELMERHARWALDGSLREGRAILSPPLMGVRRPFGKEEEAERMPCPCGALAYVVGAREFPGLMDGGRPRLFRQALYRFCLACAALDLLAVREDQGMVDLQFDLAEGPIDPRYASGRAPASD